MKKKAKRSNICVTLLGFQSGALTFRSCCIDKTSSAELSEAINSMWQWYENAEVCVVYLPDVPAISANPVQYYITLLKASGFGADGLYKNSLRRPELYFAMFDGWY